MKHVIFDFDGTLADGLPVILEIAKDLVPSFSLTDEEVAKLRNLSAREVIRQSGIPYYRLVRLLMRGKKMFAARVNELEMFKGMPEAIRALHKEGYQLSIVSSNDSRTIQALLVKYDLTDCISAIYGNVGLFSKSRVFKRILRQSGTTTQNSIYVGDEVRDIESAKKARLPIVSVSWGFNSEAVLAEYQPTYLARTPKELLKVLKGHTW